MKFKIDQRSIVLNGITQGSVREFKAKKLNKIIAQEGQLSMIYVREVSDESVRLCSVEVDSGKEGTVKQILESIEKLLSSFDDILWNQLSCRHSGKAKFKCLCFTCGLGQEKRWYMEVMCRL